MLKILANLEKGVSIVIVCALLLISYISMWDRTMGEINEFEKRKENLMKNEIIEFIRKTIRYSAGILSSTAIITCLIYAYSCADLDYFKSLFHTVNMHVIPLFFFGVIISYLIKKTSCVDYGYQSTPKRCSNILYITNTESALKSLSTHEAGHAFVAYILGLRFSAHITCERSYISVTGDFVTAEQLRSIILVEYAGTVAEGILLGERILGSYGTKDADINIARTNLENYVFMTRDDLSKCPDDPKVKELVFKLSKEYFEEAQKLILENQKVVHELATEFAKKQDWEYEDIEKFMELKGISPSKNDFGAGPLLAQI
mgnify:FL=1